MKVAIVVLSDPNAGEEALGRVFNALAAAYDFKAKGNEVRIYFHGTGTRWPEVLSSVNHPINVLFEAVKASIVGVSSGCADVFGAKDGAEKSGFKLVQENMVPGTSGLPSVADIAADGFTVLTF
ncbi:DsrE family protein [Luteibacter aegosomatis]|uniref:DsrE family protein n=1 Tax=Luteibacter aegosomatis TaxID=2911537 RepID=UPI001FFB0961|nr:DsrE family protein [Luteibacter aegosomatis]UPG85598.1 DsrE family protein [Luteibacter aegosomatis]